MILLLVGACVHTPAHAALPGRWSVGAVHREVVPPEGPWCSWDAEELRHDGATLWSVTPPDSADGEHNEAWCEEGGEASRTMDVVGDDGPFVSTVLRAESCCPRELVVRCVTWDLRTRAPASLEDYDSRLAARRWAELQKRLDATGGLGGGHFERDAFLIRPGGHVAFCGIYDGVLRQVLVR